MTNEHFPHGKNVLTQISDGEGKKYPLRDLLLIGVKGVSLMSPFYASMLSEVFGYMRGARVERRIIR